MDVFEFPLNDKKEVKQGDLLIAEPFLSDPNFARSVVLVCEHSSEGSFGLVINKPAELSIEEATNFMFVDNNIFVGGPVEQDTLHFIHTIAQLENAIPLKNGVYWGGDYEQLKEMNADGMVNKRNCRFFAGYSGWGKGQLKGELDDDSWVISRIPLDILFELDADKIWQEVLRLMGNRYKILSNYPIDPRLN